MSDPASYFRPFGTCRCGKPATGTLMSFRNDPMGYFCARCAETRVKLALKEREAERRQRAAQ